MRSPQDDQRQYSRNQQPASNQKRPGDDHNQPARRHHSDNGQQQKRRNPQRSVNHTTKSKADLVTQSMGQHDMKQPHSTTAETSAARELQGLVDLLHELAESHFFGELTVSFNGGRMRHVRQELSLLPSQLRNRPVRFTPAMPDQDEIQNAHHTTG